MSIVVSLPVTKTTPGFSPDKLGDLGCEGGSNADFANNLKLVRGVLDKLQSNANDSMEAVSQPDMGLLLLLNQFPELKEVADPKTFFEEGAFNSVETTESKGTLPVLTDSAEIDSALMSPKLDSGDQILLNGVPIHEITREAGVTGEGRMLTEKGPQNPEELLLSNHNGINIPAGIEKVIPDGQRVVIRTMPAAAGSQSNQALAMEDFGIKAGVDSQSKASTGFNGEMENHDGTNQTAKVVNQLISLESERMRGIKNPENPQGNTGISEGEAILGTSGNSDLEPALLNKETIPEKPVSSKQVIEQVIKSMERMPLSRSSDVTIKLEPEYLGKLHIHLQIRDDVMVASFSTENQLAKQLLESGLGNLRLQLEASGIRLERAEVNVDLGNEWGGFGSSEWSEDHQSRHQFNSATGYEPSAIMTKMGLDEWPEEDTSVNYSGDATVNYLI